MKRKMRIIGWLSMVLLVCVLVGQGIWLYKVHELEMKRFEQEVSSLLRVSFDEYMNNTFMVSENRFSYAINEDQKTFIYGGGDTVKEMVLFSIEQYHEMGKAVFYDYLFDKQRFNVLGFDSLYRHNLKNAGIDKSPVIIVRDSVGQILMSSAIMDNLAGEIRTLPIDVGYTYRHRIEAVFDLPFIFHAMILHLLWEFVFLIAFSGCLMWLWRSIRLTWQSVAVQTMGIAHLEHELKKPLAAMISALGKIANRENRELTQVQERKLQLMEARLKKIAEITDTMLTTFKGSCLEIDRVPVDIARKMTEIEEMFRILRPHVSLEFEVETGIREPLLDKVYFSYLIINLVDNAIKYGGDEPWVKVSFYKEEGEWVLTVADHGIGMPAKVLKHIFRQFYRVKDKRVAGKTGFGLGLAFVRKVVEAYKGEIRVESMPGKGSKFEIRIKTE